MSVKVMTAVFERYPNGGGEMLLALALADHASDDGTRVFPGIKSLCDKTRQSERTVQYQLRRMEEMGWLILVGVGNGGRSMHREYRISLDWIKGAEIAPFKKGAIGSIKGANDDTKGCNPAQERVQPIAPANNHQESSEKGESANALGIPPQLFEDFLEVRKAKSAGPLTATAIEGLLEEAEAACITVEQAVKACCKNSWPNFVAAWHAERAAPKVAPTVAPNKAKAQPHEANYVPPVSSVWHQSVAGIAAKAAELGLKPQDAVMESHPVFKARVMAAEKNRGAA
ncbi:hypothetical protein BH10PSE16_BH10PSE16_01080 [soil metagenome]